MVMARTTVTPIKTITIVLVSKENAGTGMPPSIKSAASSYCNKYVG
jgi:hypothetical protein